jgi:acylphosphatase
VTVEEADIVRARVRMRGLVQGVGFRFFAQREAARLGLAGFARNLPDGSVEIEAEGPRAAVEAFVRRVREGPRGAVVEHAEVTWAAPRGEQGFTIG